MNVVVVGCGNVGFETVRLLADGHTLLVVSRSYPEDVRRFVDEHASVSFVQADATDREAMSQALADFGNRSGDIDALISTVGFPGSGSALDGFEQFKEDFDANLFGNLIPVKAVLEHMLAQRRGKIIVISSTSGVHTYPGWGAYAPVKWALTNLCRTLRAELAPEGICVNVVFPRTIKNERSKTFLNRAGIEPQQVAREVVRVLEQKKGRDRFVPKRYELLRPLERVFPQMLDKKAGLRKDRRTHFSSRPVQTVLINGATSPLGRELAGCYAATAQTLYLLGSDEQALSEVAQGLSEQAQGTITPLLLRGTEAGDIRNIAATTGRVDAVISCDTSSREEALASVSRENCERHLTASFFAPLALLMEYLRRGMQPQKIINILSTAAATGCPGQGCIAAGQAALWAQTRSIRRTLGNDVQVMEVLLSSSRQGAQAVREAAERIHRAEQRGREMLVLPSRSRTALYLDAICPGVFA